MTRLYFVRHAEPDFDWIDNKTRPLTEEGFNDTQKVLNFFKQISNKQLSIDEIYSSPYERAVKTILSTSLYFDKQIIIDDRLRERESGVDGNKGDIFKKRWDDKNFCEQGGESINIVQTRNMNAINDILQKHKDKSIIIGTHGTSLSTILNYYDNSFGYDGFLRILNWMPYIIELVFDHNKIVDKHEHLFIEKIFKNREIAIK